MSTDSIPGLGGLTGYELLAALCVLMLVEELGVPMPFAPGDLLLVLAGSAITVGHLNPFVVAISAYASALAGALGGRELFERLGTSAVQRLANFLRVTAHVDRLSSRVHRGGSVAVFVGRITPGLRVCTTQVSGIVKLPRLTFIRGLAPGILVYDAVFLTLGATMGPAAWTAIRQHESTALLVGVCLAAMITVAALAQASRRISADRNPSPATRLGME